MIIRTSANLDKKIFRRICEAGASCGIGTQKIIHILLKKIILDKPLKIRFDRAVKYQGSRSRDRWRCVHLELTQRLYESSIDMRKLTKFSVSYLLSYAVEVYLDQIVDEIVNGEDAYNYPDSYCIFIHQHSEKLTYAVFYSISDIEEYCKSILNST